MFPRWMALALLAFVAVTVGGCGSKNNTRKAHEAAQQVSEDTRRVVRIPEDSPPETARTVMGRAPDAVQSESGDEIHYYFIRGAVGGEALRLVYRNNRLIERRVVQLQQND